MVKGPLGLHESQEGIFIHYQKVVTFCKLLFCIGLCIRVVVPKFFGTGDQFCGRQFSLNQSWRVGGEGDFRMIQAHYIYWAFYFYYYYITSISDHQALDPDVGDP